MSHRPGDRCPALAHRLTAADVVAVSTAARELRPVHLDAAAARATGLPDVILGTTGQQAWLWRYLVDWFGTGARLLHLDLRMLAPISPGRMVIDGEVVAVDEAGTADLSITITIDDALATNAQATVDFTRTANWPPWDA